MGVETDLRTTLQGIPQEVVTLLTVVLHMNLALPGIGGLLLEYAHDDIQ